MKKIGIVIVVLMAVAAAVWYFQDPETPSAGGKSGGPVPVVVAPVVRDVFATTVQAVGTARANEAVDISAKVTETVAEIAFEDGQRVQAGDLIVQLSNARQMAELELAKVNLAEQQREYRRLAGLVQQKAISQSQLDAQKSRLEAARAQLAAAQTSLADRRIVAPFDGVLGLRRVSPGALVEPGDVITTLDAIDPIKLDFTVPETYLATLRPGLSVSAFTTAYPGETFAGEVVSIDSRIDPATRAVTVRAHVPNPEGRLRPGMLLTVELVSERRESLILPEAALVPLGEHQYVFVVDEANKAQRVEVTLGRRRPGEVEVLSGIAAGDRVVVEGTIRIKPGAETKIVREAGSAG